MPDSRKLKIHTKLRSRTYDTITVSEIRLEGKWLEKVGFREEHFVEVKAQKNKLTIVPLPPDED